MTTPPSDPYGTPSSGGDDRPPPQPPPYPGPAAGQPPSWREDQPTVRPEPPSSILAAVRLMYVGAGLQLLVVIFGLLTRDEVREQLAEQQPELTESEIDTAATISLVFVVLIGLLAVAMWLWMAQANKRGYGWARIVATVLGGLNIAFTFFSLFQSAGVGLIVQLITIALAAAILFLLYRPDSTEYYNAVSRQPR